jgi:flagellar basal-body rod protein FlgG
MPQDAARGQKYILPQSLATPVFSQGGFQRTGSPTHAAIDGDGFFEVQLPDGSLGYTRDGEFSLDSGGQLVTKQGYPVMGTGGAIQFDRNLQGEVSIGPDGTVSKGGDARGRLRVVAFQDRSVLKPAGAGIWKPDDPNIPKDDVNNPSVRGGALELANTSVVGEMIGMITAMRAFEANQKVIQSQDERMGRIISELGYATN